VRFGHLALPPQVLEPPTCGSGVVNGVPEIAMVKVILDEPRVVRIGKRTLVLLEAGTYPLGATCLEPTLTPAGGSASPASVRQRVQALRTTLDLVQLLNQMRTAQQRLVDIADRPIMRWPPRLSNSSSPAWA
jgi:hypothetical protein